MVLCALASHRSCRTAAQRRCRFIRGLLDNEAERRERKSDAAADRHICTIHKVGARPTRGLLSGQECSYARIEGAIILQVRAMASSSDNPIPLRLGPSNGNAPFLEFVNMCSALRVCLLNVERCLYGKESEEYEIADLTKGSARIAIGPLEGSERFSAIRETFAETIVNLQSGQPVDPTLDFKALRAFNLFSSAIRSRVPLAVDGVVLTGEYVASLAKLLEPISRSRGSVSGRLEAISVHGAKQFTLFPPFGDEDVTCHFPEDMMPKVVDAIEQFLTVYGTLHYSLGKVFPLKVDVEEFEVHPNADTLPTLLDTRGSLHFDLPSETIVRAIRDEWR
jgi:hypothetical protein